MTIEEQEQTGNKNENRVESIQQQFIEAIKSQEQLGRSNARIIRYGGMVLLIFFALTVFLVWSQQQNIQKTNAYIENMAKGVSSMTRAIEQMQSNMGSVEAGIKQVARHTQTISHLIIQPDNSNSVAVLTHIAQTIQLMQKDAHGFSSSIDNINYNLNKINKQMQSLNRKLGIMGQDVNRMPSPVKMFPF